MEGTTAFYLNIKLFEERFASKCIFSRVKT